jgi:hypothetical protein
VILISRKGMILAYFFSYKPLFQSLPSLPYIFYFIRTRIMESVLLCIFWIALSLIMPPSVQFEFSLGIRLCKRRFVYLQGVVFMDNLWNFKAIPNTNTILTLVSHKRVLKKI